MCSFKPPRKAADRKGRCHGNWPRREAEWCKHRQSHGPLCPQSRPVGKYYTRHIPETQSKQYVIPRPRRRAPRGNVVNLGTVWLASQLTKYHLPTQQGDDGAPRHLLALEHQGPVFMQLWWGFFNKYSRPCISAGLESKRFAPADSTDHGWKTVFLHLQVQFPNRRFPSRVA